MALNSLAHMAVVSPEALTLLRNNPTLTPLEKKISSPLHASLGSSPSKVSDKGSLLTENNQSTPVAPAKNSPAPRVETQKKPLAFKNDVMPSARNPVVEHPKEMTAAPIKLETQSISLGDLALKINKSVSEIILNLLKKGIVCTKNQLLTPVILHQLARDFNIEMITSAPVVDQNSQKVVVGGSATESHATHRSPIVVIIGHVDHGKTTLLDYIRKTKVAAKEKGGITQHLGAYEVSTSKGHIVFLDTPGHEAFSKMRSRGVRIADIAILLVAADDGVKPQTIEAIKHAQSANIPIIVALNKIDKASPGQIEAAKRGLMQHGLAPEEWGGQTIIVPISAKTGDGIDNLLDMMSLQAELMELKASDQGEAKGFVLEAKIEKGFGPVATVIGQQGTIAIGDYFLAGSVSGRVNALINSEGKRLKHVGPSIPIRIAGFNELPQSGDSFEVVSQSSYKKLRSPDKVRLMSGYETDHTNKTLNIILKADNNSSHEAIVGSIENLPKKNSQPIRIIYSGVGDINENDITLAHNTKAIIYGFNVKTDGKVLAHNQQLNSQIHNFQIIYQLLDDVAKRATLAPEIKYISTKIGEAVVICTFKVKGIGLVAGANVKEGKLSKEGKLIVKRGKYKVGEGNLKGLERERRSVKEVHAGFECAFSIEGFDDWQVDDRVECYMNVATSVENN